MAKSWMIGDRPTDIECGFRAGVKTIGLTNKKYNFNKLKKKPNFFVKNIDQVISLIK